MMHGARNGRAAGFSKKKVKGFDRVPGTKSKQEKEYPYLVARCYFYGSPILKLASDHWREDVPATIYDNDWIPSKVAALALGISKLAISDRIRRSTIESRKGPRGKTQSNNGIACVTVNTVTHKKGGHMAAKTCYRGNKHPTLKYPDYHLR